MSYQPIAPPPPPRSGDGAHAAAAGRVRPTIKPGKAWYWIGGLLIAAGVTRPPRPILGWAARRRMRSTTSPASGCRPRARRSRLDFKKSGEYRIYYEWRSEADGQRVDNDDHDPPAEPADHRDRPRRRAVIPSSPDDEDFSFSFNDKLGQAVAKVDIPAPGTYTMQVTIDATEPFVIGVGKGALQTIWPWWLLGIIGAFVVGVGLGLLRPSSVTGGASGAGASA